MAWANSDWTKSGIRDTYRWVMCDNRTLKEIADMTGFVDGRISASYEGDLKYSGSITVSNSNFVTGRLLRCYYTATLESEGRSKTICLGTFFTGNDQMRYLHGRYTGTIELYSMLKSQTDSKLMVPVTFKKDNSALNSWWQLLQASGSKAYGIARVKDAKWKKNETMDFGETSLTALNRIAEFLNGQITCDAKGHIVLEPYVVPSKKPVSYSVPSGASSLVFEGVDATFNRTDCVNRFGVRYEQVVEKKVQDGVYKAKYTDSSGVTHEKGSPKYRTEKVKVPIYGQARLAKDNAYSFEKRGRFIDEVDTLQNMDPETKEKANEIAARRLKRFARGDVQYTFNSYYMPYDIGQVVRFTYKDNEKAAGIDIDGLVTNMELTLGITGLRMQTTIRRVRAR